MTLLMLFRDWFGRRHPASRSLAWKRKVLPRQPYRPVLEVLEDRLPPGNLLSTTWASADALQPPAPLPAAMSPAPAVPPQFTSTAPGVSSPTLSPTPTLPPLLPPPTPLASAPAVPVNIQPAAVTPAATLSPLDASAASASGSGGGTSAPPLVAASAPATSGSTAAAASTATPVSPPAFLQITGISKDTGFSSHDFVTNDTMAQVLGTGTPGAAFTLQVDGKAAATGTVAANGTFSIGAATAFSEGTHQLAVQPSGASAPTSTVNVKIETTPPSITLTAPDFATNRPLPQLSVQIDPSKFDGPPVFQIDVDLKHDGSFTDPGDQNYFQGFLSGATTNFMLTNPLAEGTYQLRARISDLAGNVGVSPTVTMQVDPNADLIGQQALVNLGAAARGWPPLWSPFALGYGPDGMIMRMPDMPSGQTAPPPAAGQGAPVSGSAPAQAPPASQPSQPPASQQPLASQPSQPPTGTTPGQQPPFTPMPPPVPPTPQQQYNEFVYDNQGRVLVSVRATLGKYMDGLEADLKTMGMQVIGTFAAQNMIQGYLPIEHILDLPTLANFSTATGVLRPVTNATPTQGGPPILQPGYIAATGATGSGVKIGVISDSVNQVGGGIASSIASGDLPASGVQVLLDDTGDPNATDEGRAMLEIDHHIAPGASLAFSAATSAQVMASGITNLHNVGSQVIEDDIRFLDSPFFNDGIIAQAATNAVAAGSFYASAAGNQANQGWQGAWKGTSGTEGGITSTFEDFGGGNLLQKFTLPVGGQLDIIFQWDAAFLEGGSPLSNFQVPNELDALVTDSTGATLEADYNTNTLTTDEAYQQITFTNDGSFGTNDFAFAFQLAQGPAPTQLRWVSFGDDPMATGEGAPTTFGQAAAKSVVAVAAVNWATPTTPEPYTSLGGPLTFLFDQNGNRLAAPEIRNKPDVTAPDDVDTSFFGTDDDGDGFPNFAGTSAATPHAGAAAALLISQEPSITTPAFVTQYLEQTAMDIGAPGYDNLTGFGLIQLRALPPLPPLPPTVVPFIDAEKNQTSDTATQLGVLTGGQEIDNLGIEPVNGGLPDYDWFRWSAGTAGTFTANMDVTAGGNLELHVWTLSGNTLVELGSATQTVSGQTLSLGFGTVANAALFVEVKGRNSSPGVQDSGDYNLKVQLQ